MRIGAKALDCLPVLKQAKGVNFYRDYPEVSMIECTWKMVRIEGIRM